MQKKRVKILLMVVMIIIITMMSPASVKAEESTNRVIKIACGMNDALYLDESGNIAGICLPYLQQLAWNNNWTMEYVEGSYNESLQNLLDGKVDMMFPVGLADDTEGRLAYSEFIGGYQQIGLFAKNDADIFYDDFEGFNGKKVGLSIGSNSEIVDTYADENNFSIEKVSLNSVQDKIDALINGDVDMVAFSTLNTVPGGKLVAVLDQVPFYFCTTKDKQDILQEINKGMSVAMVNTPDIVAQMYQNVMKGYNSVSFTRKENEKIKSSQKITFGVYGDRLPLAGVDTNGNSIGIYVDIIKEMEKLTGLNIEIKTISDSNRLYSYMDDKTVDFVIGLDELRYSQDNADWHLMSNDIAEYTNIAVTAGDYQFTEDEGVTFALTKDQTYLVNYINLNFKNPQISYFDTRKDCLNEIEDGNCEVAFLNVWEFNYVSKNARYQNLKEWETYSLTSGVALGATRQSDLELLSILEKVISQISSETVAEIAAANTDRDYQYYDFKDYLYGVRTQIFVVSLIIIVLIIIFIIYFKVRGKYIKDLVTANNTKSEFLSRMSHELRTPLNAINGYTTIVKQDAESGNLSKDAVVENMNSIGRASGYLLGIIKDILDVQRMETGKYSLNNTEVNPREFINTIVELIKPMAEKGEVDFQWESIDDGIECFIFDEVRVQQIILNMLYNAVKFTPKGGNVKLVGKVLSKDGKTAEVEFSVSDTGIGMSQEFIDTKLFKKFTQENQDITSPYEGCGNGLAICKELVGLMGGKISCKSKQGVGRTFTVILNMRYRQKKEDAEKKAEVYDLSGKRILLCEDNPMNQEMTKRLLGRMNCEVEIAANGKLGVEAFANSEANYYSLILMDIRMPQMDGLEATRQIRAMERGDAQAIPILALSANAFAEDVKKSIYAGMNEHLAKPVDARILYQKIKMYCE